jgi:hypothetical protein
MLGDKVNGTLRERVAFAAPEIPSDVTVNIFSIKACCIQDSHCLFQNYGTYAVTGQCHNCTFSHICSI